MVFDARLVKITVAETGMLMDKWHPSRKQHCRLLKPCRVLTVSLFALAVSLFPEICCAVSLSHPDVLRIGKRIWQNECNGTISGLTAWNEGEDFASLGIGHFIWYPRGPRGPFDESFPKLVSFISSRGAKLPTLLLGVG